MNEAVRATVRVVLACDNSCVFCAQTVVVGDRSASLDAIASQLREARARADEVTFVGGEPTLHEDLPAIIAEARTLGFRRIGLQTNGRRLARVIELNAGLTDVHLSIHGASAAVHDYHTGVPGSFAAAIAALGAARAAGLPTVVTTVLTRSNARGLTDVPRLFASRGISAWCISIPRVRGRAAELFDRVVPRLGIAMPFALHAIQTAVSLRLPTMIHGAPTCSLGPFARFALPAEERAYGEACTQCAARPGCPGVEPEYLARFAGDELIAREAADVALDPELARMFVGVGELSPPRDVAVAEAPQRARVALPMAGKVKPALAEVPRTAEKKTGAALRELFKDLYQGEPVD